jgi:P-type E1-E2 ATPase
MAFSGTFVASGNGAGVAVATGAASQLGRISTLVGTIETLTTPLIRQMDELARKLTVIILIVSAAIFAFAVLMRGYQWQEAFMVMIGLVVAAIPEGLPAVTTITLAIGVQRMAVRTAIVRRLPAVETLGSVSVT